MQLLYAKIKELVCAQATNTNKSGKDYFSTVVPAPCSDLVSLLHSFFCTNVCCFSHVLSVAFCLPVTFTPKWPSFMSKKLIGVKPNRPPFLILIGVKPNRPPFLMDLSFFLFFFWFFFLSFLFYFLERCNASLKVHSIEMGMGAVRGEEGGGWNSVTKNIACAFLSWPVRAKLSFWWHQRHFGDVKMKRGKSGPRKQN